MRFATERDDFDVEVAKAPPGWAFFRFACCALRMGSSYCLVSWLYLAHRIELLV